MEPTFWYDNQTLQLWVEALLTLGVLTYLWKENPIFRVMQYIFVGLYTAYSPVYYWDAYGKKAILTDIPDGKWWLVIGIALGLLFYFRYFPSVAWIARIPMAYIVGYGSGYTLAYGFQPLFTQLTNSFQKIAAYYPDTALVNPGGFWLMKSVWNLVFLLMLLSSLVYFFFTVKRDNPLIRVGADWGRWTIMLALGAAFGNTTMARISLFIGRLGFLLRDWLKLAS